MTPARKRSPISRLASPIVEPDSRSIRPGVIHGCQQIGLMVGHELDIYRKREATEEADKDKVLVLPDIDLGDAIVLEVRRGFAEALITNTTNLPIYRGDQIRTKTR